MKMNSNFKNTSIGKIPVDWEDMKLEGIISKFIVPMRDKPKKFVGNIPWCRIEDIEGKYLSDTKSEQYVDETTVKDMNLKIHPAGTVICSCSARLGVCAITTTDLITNQTFIGLVPSKKVDKEFLYYMMSFSAERLQKLSSGTTIAYLSRQEFEKFRIPFPPIGEQQKIASILSTWDKAIELKERLIEQKKEQKKGLMQKLLTGEVRLPGFDGEWEEVKLEQVVDRVKGKVIKYSEDGLYPAIDMEYLESGIFRNYTNDDSVLANKNDVLLLWDGSRAGRAFTGMKGSVGSTFVKLTCKRINNIFLQKHLELNEKRIQRLREGSGIPHIPKDFLSIYKIKVPKKQEQEAIAEILLKMDEKIILLRKEAELLKQQKKGLMQLLLTGKVRVKV